MKKQEKYIIFFFTIPATIFIFLVIGLFYLMLTAYAILIISALLIGTIGYKKLLARYNRFILILVLVFFILYPNIILLPSQFVRRLPGGRNALIEPDHPSLPEINATFQQWHLDRYGILFEDVNNFKTETDRVDYFVDGVLIEYKYDLFQPYMLEDHIPTMDEIVASDFDGNGKLEDDCDGITIMTASFLIFLGYTNVFISEIDFHWHTIVYEEGVDPRTPEGYAQGNYLYASNHYSSYYIFNQTDLFVPPTRTIFDGILDIMMGDYITKYLGRLVIAEWYIDFHPVVWIILIILASLVIMVLFSILLSLFNKHWNPNKRKIFKGFLLSTTFMSLTIGSAILMYYLRYYVDYFNQASFSVLNLGNFIIFLGIGISMRIFDSIVINSKKRSRKKEDKQELNQNNNQSSSLL